jgi:tetratricopeptide (TPR) repeat protein
MGGVGQRIKELRKASQMTQQELAEGVVTRSYISQIEKGLIQPSYDTLEKLSKKLNCTVEDFFKEPENTALRVAEWKKYIRFAEGHIESGQYDQARRTLTRCNLDPKGEQELNDHDLGLLYWVRGKLCEASSQYEQAEQFYQVSLQHLQSYLYVKERVRTMDSLAYLHLQENRSQKALEILHDAMAILLQHQLGGLLKISVLVHAGVAHSKIGENRSAIRLLTEAQRINQDLGAHYKAGDIASSLGICHLHLQELEAAKQCFLRALDYYELGQEDANRAEVLNHLGKLYRHMGKYEESIRAFEEAHDLFAKLGQKLRALNAKLELSQSCYLCKEDTRAQEICEQVLNETDKPHCQARAFKIIGLLKARSGQHLQALQFLKRSYDLLHPLVPKEAVEVLSHIADTHYALGDLLSAANGYRDVYRNSQTPFSSC